MGDTCRSEKLNDTADRKTSVQNWGVIEKKQIGDRISDGSPNCQT